MGRLIRGSPFTIHWRHNDHHGVSNHQPYDGLLNRLFRRRSKENIKAPRHWPLCGEFTGTGKFPTQRASYAENVSIWWRHHQAILGGEVDSGWALTALLRSPGWLQCISPDIAQSMLCAIGSIYDIIKGLFCFRHSTPSNYYLDVRLLAGVEHRNVCRVYPAESVSKMEISRLPLCNLWGSIWQPQKWRNAINRNFRSSILD